MERRDGEGRPYKHCHDLSEPLPKEARRAAPVVPGPLSTAIRSGLPLPRGPAILVDETLKRATSVVRIQ
jgi:hypothetical protein